MPGTLLEPCGSCRIEGCSYPPSHQLAVKTDGHHLGSVPRMPAFSISVTDGLGPHELFAFGQIQPEGPLAGMATALIALGNVPLTVSIIHG